VENSLNNFWGNDRARRRLQSDARAPLSDPLPPAQEPEAVARPPISATPKPPVEREGAATLAQVMEEVDHLSDVDSNRFQPLATGFNPLDDVLNGGLRPGELMVVGGAFGVGKTIFALQVARNVALHHPDSTAIYVCYEHDRSHLLSRLLCLESAERGYRDDALTLRKLAQMAQNAQHTGMMNQLRAIPRYAPLVRGLEGYGERLVLVKASGRHATLAQIGEWVAHYADAGRPCLLVVDYLQKIPTGAGLTEEAEVTTYLTQGLKELALETGARILAIAAADRAGLKSRRMYLSDLRGSSALQYEADVGLIFNNKHAIVSREQMIYNLNQADAMRNWLVISVEKNRSGRTAVDMEFMRDPAHFRMFADGDYVRDRLVDERVTLE
jgi:replicative DNA helicase